LESEKSVRGGEERARDQKESNRKRVEGGAKENNSKQNGKATAGDRSRAGKKMNVMQVTKFPSKKKLTVVTAIHKSVQFSIAGSLSSNSTPVTTPSKLSSVKYNSISGLSTCVLCTRVSLETRGARERGREVHTLLLLEEQRTQKLWRCQQGVL
jgi:hypothetical protein